MLSSRVSSIAFRTRTCGSAKRTASVSPFRVSPSPSVGVSVTKRWHTHVESSHKGGSKSVEEMKAAVEARLAGAPKLSDFMSDSSPKEASGTY